ncbi:MAG: NAD(P)H-dependent oxidoreductase [Granulosicoccus sp.]
MKRVLIIFSHPGQRHSHINVGLADVARSAPGISFVDLYAEYPRFKINVDVEQQRLLAHDIVIFQFPIHWYSTPSLLKEWQDLVLEHGFAYGPGGDQLAGKILLPVVTAGGAEDAYRVDGVNRFSLRTLLSPLEQTANLCQMQYVPPFVLFSSLAASADGRAEIHMKQYKLLLEALQDERLDISACQQRDLLKDGALPIISRV